MKKKAKKHLEKLSDSVFGDTKMELPDGYVPRSTHNRSQKSFTSIRTAIHRDQKIKVKTTYRIEIDGSPLQIHTMVMDDGTVHCHGLPAYSFASAIDMARSVIDASMLTHVDTDELRAPKPGKHKKGGRAISKDGH